MRTALRQLLCAMLLCCAAAGGALATPGEVPVGGMLREADLRGLSGPSRKLSEFRGMPLIINVWASWCGPCRKEMGSLERLSQRYGKRLRVIGISTDDYFDRAQAAVRESKVSFANFIDQRLLLENMLGADRIPLTLLVDAQGRVLSKIYGAEEWDSKDAVAYIAKTFRIKL